MREIQKVPPGLARERIEMGAHWTRLGKRLTRKSGTYDLDCTFTILTVNVSSILVTTVLL